MRTKPSALLACLLLVVAVFGTRPPDDAAARFEAIIDRYLVTRRGRDADVSMDAIGRCLADQKSMLAAGLVTATAGLGPEQRIDRLLLEGQLEGSILELETVRRWEVVPELYLQHSAESGALGEEGLTTDEQATRVTASLQAATETLRHARENLTNPPGSFTEGTRFQAAEWLGFLRSDGASFAKAAWSARTRLATASAGARAVFEAFIGFLDKDLLPRSARRIAIGREHCDYLLKHRWYMTKAPRDPHPGARSNRSGPTLGGRHGGLPHRRLCGGDRAGATRRSGRSKEEDTCDADC